MTNQHDIDILFKSKLDEKTVDFSESAWEKANALLDVKESKRKRIIYYSFATAILVVLISASVFFNVNPSKIDVLKLSGTKNMSNSNVKPEINEKQPKNASNETLISTMESVEKAENSQKAISQPTIGNTQDNGKLTQSDLQVKNSNNQPELISNETIQPELNEVTPIVLNTNTIFHNPKQEESSNSIEKMTPLTYDGEDYREENLTNTDEPDNYTNPWFTHGSFGLVIGANVSQGFKDSNGKSGLPSLGPVLGLRYSHRVNNDFSFDVNVLYQNRAALNSVLFDNKDIITKTESKTLHYIDIPFFFNYRYLRHNITMGYQHSQLIGSTDKISQYKNEQNTVVLVSSSKKMQNNGSFSSFDGAIILGYEYVLSERINIGLRGNYGLFDVTDNITFADYSKHRNVQFRFLIDYKFLKH